MRRVKPYRSRGPLWFDSDCKRARYDAVAAGERGDQDCTEKCRNYRNLKQRKKRQFKQSCINKIEEICVSNRGCMWETISAFAPKTLPVNLPGGVEFLDHYKQLAQPVKSSDFDYQHEHNIKES